MKSVTVYSSNLIWMQSTKIYKPTLTNKIVAWYSRVFKKEKNMICDTSNLSKFKNIITAFFLIISLNCYSQKKDSTQIITDSTEVITWQDVQSTLQSFYGRIEKEKYEQAQTFFSILWNNAINRKNKKK